MGDVGHVLCAAFKSKMDEQSGKFNICNFLTTDCAFCGYALYFTSPCGRSLCIKSRDGMHTDTN